MMARSAEILTMNAVLGSIILSQLVVLRILALALKTCAECS